MAFSRINKLDIKRIWPAHGDVPAPKELLVNAIEMFADWAVNADPENDLEKEGTVFGRACLFHHKDMVLAYKPQHLDEMRVFMKDHDGAIIVWNFIKHFRRTAEGKSVYDPVVCWGER
jgi:hypothetical protein